ncbi:hypothetical protein KY345_03285 [Candidatus Woesearchaeota archaeon]|nr:hypothetical protein [Candidatus Woesearchaeota archaeon]
MWERDEFDLERARECVLNGSDSLKDAALDKIVEFIGWPVKTPYGSVLKRGVERIINIMIKNWRKNKENYAHHCIYSAKGVSGLLDYGIYDLTLGFGALNHDNPEEAKGYEENKRKFEYAKNEKEREDAIKNSESIRRRCLTETAFFFTCIDDRLVSASGLEPDGAVMLEDSLTKRPDEFYYEYLQRIASVSYSSAPESRPLLDALRRLLIKTAGDRPHNNRTVPRKENPRQENRFTIPQRLKESYKSMMVINRNRKFIDMYSEAKETHPKHFDFLKKSTSKLIKIADNIVTDDMAYLTPTIDYPVTLKIKSLFGKYHDYVIREPASYDEIVADPKKIFDGTLARYDIWLRKKYRWGIAKPEDIRLSDAHKRWMRDQLGITDPKMRLFVQEYLDCLVFHGVFSRLLKNPRYIVTGFDKIND